MWIIFGIIVPLFFAGLRIAIFLGILYLIYKLAKNFFRH